MRWCVAIVMLAACGRPSIDPSPYNTDCGPLIPSQVCPADYTCTLEGNGAYTCLVPCDDDDDCPDGFACNTGSDYLYNLIAPQRCYSTAPSQGS